MYYKITDKTSEPYKKLHALRTNELQQEEENKRLIAEKIKHEWEKWYGTPAQSGFSRLKEYVGFEFTNPNELDPMVWKEEKSVPGVYVPNKRTKAGREIKSFLNNLRVGNYLNVYDCIGIQHPSGRFTIPYLLIVNEIIVLILDDSHHFEHGSPLVEITRSEFQGFIDQFNAKASQG